MSKLYETRKHSLIKLLNKDEMGYAYSSKLTSLIVDDIKQKKYGS